MQHDDRHKRSLRFDRSGALARRRRCVKASLSASRARLDPAPRCADAGGADGELHGRVGKGSVAIADLVADPARASEIPVEQIPALVADRLHARHDERVERPTADRR